MTYQIDSTMSLVREHWFGTIRPSELTDYWTALMSDKDALAIRRSLADLTECEIGLSGEHLTYCVQTILIPTLKDRKWKAAILVGTPVQHGVTRQFAALASQIIETQIFYDPALALSWIQKRPRS